MNQRLLNFMLPPREYWMRSGSIAMTLGYGK
jgi:hypothetical protein